MPLVADALDLADRHRLTVYDALYLELAADVDAELATLDRDLTRAARAEGVGVVAAGRGRARVPTLRLGRRRRGGSAGREPRLPSGPRRNPAAARGGIQRRVA
jgi:hypothetical protein